MSRTIYLVDFENVHEQGLEGLRELSSDDRVYLFYTLNANKISLDYLNGMQAAFIPMRVASGKQSLDMHLVSFLGYLLGSETDHDAHYVVLSKDSDFAEIEAFWNGQLSAPNRVARYVSIADSLLPEPSVLKEELPEVVDTPESRRESIRQYIRMVFRNYATPDAWGIKRFPTTKLVNLLIRSNAFNQERKLYGKKAIPFLEECFPDVLRVGVENGARYFFEVLNDEAREDMNVHAADDDTEMIRQTIRLVLHDSVEYDCKGRQCVLLAVLCSRLCDCDAYVKALKASGKRAAAYLRENFSDVLFIESIRDVPWVFEVKEQIEGLQAAAEADRDESSECAAVVQETAESSLPVAQNERADQPSLLQQKLLTNGLDPIIIKDVMETVEACSGIANAKIQLYNRLRKAMGAKSGTAVYHQVVDSIAG